MLIPWLVYGSTVTNESCLGCVCTTPRTTAQAGQLLLATQVDHTAVALRTLARRDGLTLRPLAPGLLTMDTTRVKEFVALAAAELSSVETAEVRCVVLSAQDLPDVAVLSQTLTAPLLAAACARVAHADLLPLFQDEAGCFHAVYQTIVSLPTRRPVGFEALLRGTTTDGRTATPGELFPAAEAAGWTHLIDRIGRITALSDAVGYSYLNMLVRVRPDVVKLDKDLVQGLPHATSRGVVTAIVNITHS